jgi:hypothetical protein
MKKIIRLTEADLTRIVRRVINEKTDYEPEETITNPCAELSNIEMQKLSMTPGVPVLPIGGDIVGGVLNKLNVSPEQSKTMRPQLDKFIQGLKGMSMEDLKSKLRGLRSGSITEQGIDPSAKGPAGAIMLTAVVAIMIAWIINEVKIAREYRKKRKKPGVKRNAQCLNRKF